MVKTNVSGGKKKKLTVLVVFGTRPEAIKLAPVVMQLRQRRETFRCVSCATGQHREMLDQVLRAFAWVPDYNLEIMQAGQSLAGVTSRVLLSLECIMDSELPDVVLVQGDTTTALAASLAAYYHRIPIGHVEAGLRTNNKYSPFPEEMNRRLTASLADYHFAPTQLARQNLLREGTPASRIVVTGNTVVDALHHIRALHGNGFQRVPGTNGRAEAERKKIVVTAHRRENFGKPFEDICEAIRRIAQRRPEVDIIYPVHLNPNVQEPVHHLLGGLANIRLIAPMDYISFVGLMASAYILLTDSGGIQEEGPALGKPVLVMRDVSERMEAVLEGAACLVGTDPGRICEKVEQLLDDPAAYKQMVCEKNPFGDGKASERIAQYLARELSGDRRVAETPLTGEEAVPSVTGGLTVA